MQVPPDDRPSKSARKRAALAAQKLGEELVLLKDAELQALDLPDALTEAVREARGRRAPAPIHRQAHARD
jgi:ribosome-associated protein